MRVIADHVLRPEGAEAERFTILRKQVNTLFIFWQAQVPAVIVRGIAVNARLADDALQQCKVAGTKNAQTRYQIVPLLLNRITP